jgi:hypothetical protein
MPPFETTQSHLTIQKRFGIQWDWVNYYLPGSSVGSTFITTEYCFGFPPTVISTSAFFSTLNGGPIPPRAPSAESNPASSTPSLQRPLPPLTSSASDPLPFLQLTLPLLLPLNELLFGSGGLRGWTGLRCCCNWFRCHCFDLSCSNLKSVTMRSAVFSTGWKMLTNQSRMTSISVWPRRAPGRSRPPPPYQELSSSP